MSIAAPPGEVSPTSTIYSNGRIIVHAITLEDVIGIARSRVTGSCTEAECRTYLRVASYATE